MKGWMFQLDRDIDGNPAKLRYELARPIGQDFGLDKLEALAEQMGIREPDNDNFRPGYHLSIDSFHDNPSLARRLNQAVNGQQGPVLVFQFQGFPTAETMAAMLTLEQAFLSPERPKLLRRLLGRISFRNATS